MARNTFTAIRGNGETVTLYWHRGTFDVGGSGGMVRTYPGLIEVSTAEGQDLAFVSPRSFEDPVTGEVYRTDDPTAAALMSTLAAQ